MPRPITVSASSSTNCVYSAYKRASLGNVATPPATVSTASKISAFARYAVARRSKITDSASASLSCAKSVLPDTIAGGHSGVGERRQETGASERAIGIGGDAFARRLHGAIALRVAQEVLAPALELELHARFRESFGDVGRRVIEIARRYGRNRLAHLGIALENEIRV